MSAMWLGLQLNFAPLIGLSVMLMPLTVIGAVGLFLLGGFAPTKFRSMLSERERRILDD